MAGKKERKRNIIFIVILVSFIGLGSYAFTKLHRFENIFGQNTYVSGNHVGKSARGDRAAPQASNQGLSDKQRQEFSSILNGLLGNVSTQMVDYKKRRRVFADLTKPIHLRQPDYIIENAQQMKVLLPQLKQSSNDILALFEQGDRDFIAWAQSLPASQRDFAVQRWKKMSGEQLGLFIDFFTLDHRIIDLHVQLMRLYVENRDTMDVDVINNQITFQNAAPREDQTVIFGQIQTLESRQDALFQ